MLYPGAQQYSSPYGGVPSYAVAQTVDYDPQLWNWFAAADTNRSGAISAFELQQLLRNGDWTPFDDDTIKLLMNLFDVDRSGSIKFHEFQGLWRYIKDWQNAFRHFDRDRSGTIDAHELSSALAQFGYKLTPPLIALVQRKFAPASYRGGPPPGMNFDRFVRACVMIKQLTETFQRLDVDRDGWIQTDYDQFLYEVLGLP